MIRARCDCSVPQVSGVKLELGPRMCCVAVVRRAARGFGKGPMGSGRGSAIGSPSGPAARYQGVDSRSRIAMSWFIVDESRRRLLSAGGGPEERHGREGSGHRRRGQ